MAGTEGDRLGRMMEALRVTGFSSRSVALSREVQIACLEEMARIKSAAAAAAVALGCAPKRTLSTVDVRESVRVRKELAKNILARISSLIRLLGDLSFPVNVQFLKQDLSRCHEVLKDHPSETNFLSIVTLIESALSQVKWKEYSAAQIEMVRSAVDLGHRKSQIAFEDYDRIRREFADGGIDFTPRIDLDTLDMDALTDDEEET
ncbi:MAG: hypothetical protein HQ582_20880 [Planctomycetes bacterium]|nr:hypothetical protein [Planctomycetota bacterium]